MIRFFRAFWSKWGEHWYPVPHPLQLRPWGTYSPNFAISILSPTLLNFTPIFLDTINNTITTKLMSMKSNWTQKKNVSVIFPCMISTKITLSMGLKLLKYAQKLEKSAQVSPHVKNSIFHICCIPCPMWAQPQTPLPAILWGDKSAVQCRRASNFWGHKKIFPFTLF
jgi:hypothetical protein